MILFIDLRLYCRIDFHSIQHSSSSITIGLTNWTGLFRTFPANKKTWKYTVERYPFCSFFVAFLSDGIKSPELRFPVIPVKWWLQWRKNSPSQYKSLSEKIKKIKKIQKSIHFRKLFFHYSFLMDPSPLFLKLIFWLLELFSKSKYPDLFVIFLSW